MHGVSLTPAFRQYLGTSRSARNIAGPFGVHFHLFRGYVQFYFNFAADLSVLILYYGAFRLFFFSVDFYVAYVPFFRVVVFLGCTTAVFEFCYAAADHVNRTGV